ncbi:MAG: tRNA (adenosine(37)-N6)-dimethylallyltransferase MiaA [Candidatus Saccharimonadales bacterium]
MNLNPHFPFPISQPPLVVITGPTASGKTSLAIDLAKKFGGEIICADSRTIYKEMNIGTAKPSVQEQAGVPHWGLDLVSPGEYYSAADFKKYADEKISEIRGRGNIPFLVGGTGLYIDSIIFDYKFGDKADDDKRNTLSNMSIEQLHQYCKNNNIELPENFKNKRYVIRRIEQNGAVQQSRENIIDNAVVVGISTDKQVLRDRIVKRIENMFSDGVVDEAIEISKKYGWDSEALTGNVYKLIHQNLDEKMSSDEVKGKLAILDWRLAKRQITWMNRNIFLKWMNLKQAEEYLSGILAIYR